MIPAVNEHFLENFDEVEIPSKDFALDITSSKVNGIVENLEHLKQTIYFILNTERYEYLIYPWSYGVEFLDLIGQPHSYVIPETERRIREALFQDDRIQNVSDFKFEKTKKGLYVTFSVETVFGNVESEVEINV